MKKLGLISCGTCNYLLRGTSNNCSRRTASYGGDPPSVRPYGVQLRPEPLPKFCKTKYPNSVNRIIEKVCILLNFRWKNIYKLLNLVDEIYSARIIISEHWDSMHPQPVPLPPRPWRIREFQIHHPALNRGPEVVRQEVRV